jgi:hypothetical protein
VNFVDLSYMSLPSGIIIRHFLDFSILAVAVTIFVRMNVVKALVQVWDRGNFCYAEREQRRQGESGYNG